MARRQRVWASHRLRPAAAVPDRPRPSSGRGTRSFPPPQTPEQERLGGVLACPPRASRKGEVRAPLPPNGPAGGSPAAPPCSGQRHGPRRLQEGGAAAPCREDERV